MKIEHNIKHFWAAAFFIFLFDQFTKIWALYYLPFEEEYLINKLFSFQRIFNEATVLLNYELPFGVSIFTFRVIWVTFALILTLSIYWVIKQPALQEKCLETEFAKTGLFLLIGSTWGNAFDRIFRNDGVVDFIRINCFTNSIPILNIADIMIYWADICFIITWLMLIIKIINIKLNKNNNLYS